MVRIVTFMILFTRFIFVTPNLKPFYIPLLWEECLDIGSKEFICNMILYKIFNECYVWKRVPLSSHCTKKLTFLLKTNYTGLQRNWGKHRNTRFDLIWGCWIQIWNPFLLITSSFLDMHCVHIRYIKVYMNSGLILILWDLWLIF